MSITDNWTMIEPKTTNSSNRNFDSDNDGRMRRTIAEPTVRSKIIPRNHQSVVIPPTRLPTNAAARVMAITNAAADNRLRRSAAVSSEKCGRSPATNPTFALETSSELCPGTDAEES